MLLFISFPLAVRSRSIVALVHNQICRFVIVHAAQIALKDPFHAVRIALLRIQRTARHMWHHPVTASEWVFRIAKGMVFRRRLCRPDVSSVAIQVAGLQSSRNVVGNDNSTAGGVYNPRP